MSLHPGSKAPRTSADLQRTRQDPYRLRSGRLHGGSPLMDRRTSSAQTPAPGDFATGPGPGPQPCAGTEAAAGPVVKLGEEWVRTLRHFWPEFNDWLDRVPDSRF